MRMKIKFHQWFCCLSALALFTPAAPAHAATAGVGTSFKGPVGLQLYSLREQFAKDVPGTLDEVKGFGIKYAELAGTYNVKPEDFKAQLKQRGIEAVSGHFAYERYRDDAEGAAAEAEALG